MLSNSLDYEIIKKIFKNDITKYNIDKEHIIQSILKIKYLPNILLKEICVYDIDFSIKYNDKNIIEYYNEVDEIDVNIGEHESGTLGDLFNERIRDFQSKNRISAVKRYTTIIKHLKELKLSSLPLNTLNKEHIRLFNQYLINNRRLSNAALKNYNKVLKTTLGYAEDNPRFAEFTVSNTGSH